MCGSGATAREVSNLLASAYGVRLSQMQKATDLNPEAMLAVASLEQNIISTAAVLCLQGYSWSEALRLTKEAFSEADILSQQDPCFVTYLHLLVPGVRDMLSRICGAGITCAIISNDTDANIAAFLRCQNLGLRCQSLGLRCQSRGSLRPKTNCCHQFLAPTRSRQFLSIALT